MRRRLAGGSGRRRSRGMVAYSRQRVQRPEDGRLPGSSHLWLRYETCGQQQAIERLGPAENCWRTSC